MLKYIETPITEIKAEAADNLGIRIFVKHEYKNHPLVFGNKWWKLKYNLEEAGRRGHRSLLTFGGAYSNHIYAVAAAAKGLGFKSIGIIRGEEILPLNETLDFAKSRGMKLHFVSREAYRKKTETRFVESLEKQYGAFYLIPEGGTNLLAVKGCAEYAREKLLPIEFDYLCLPVGTGGTMAGIVAGLNEKRSVIGFSVLKDGDFLRDEIKNLTKDYSGKEFPNWHIETDFHFGGYAKKTPELEQFILTMQQQHGLLLDRVYTAKMVAGVFELIKRNYFREGSKLLLLHTGGLR